MIVKYYNINYKLQYLTVLQPTLDYLIFYSLTSHFDLKPANINVMAVSAVLKARTDLIVETTCCTHCTLPIQSVKIYLITHIQSQSL